MADDQRSNRIRKKSGWKKLVNRFKKSKESQEHNIFDETCTDTALASNGCSTGVLKKNEETEATIDSQATWVSSKKSDKVKKRTKLSGPATLDGSNSVKKAQSLDQMSLRQSRKHRKKKSKNNNIGTSLTNDDSNNVTGSLKTPSAKGRARSEAMVGQKASGSKRGIGREDDLDRSLSKSFQRGFKNFRDNRAKEIKSVKTFISRKYDPNSMQKVVKQVEARQQKRNDNSLIEGTGDKPSSSLQTGKLHQGDDIFPTKRTRKSKRQQLEPAKPDPPKTHAKGGEAAKLSEDGHVLVETNKNNDGELFLPGGRPFWQQVGKGRGSEEDEDDEITDDELPMNAEVILELHRGKIALTEMPTDPVLLDPYASVAHLDSHDKKFFTRDLIFSNTVRSMINLNDETTEHERKKRHGLKRLLKFDKASAVNRYYREDNGDFVFDLPKKKQVE